MDARDAINNIKTDTGSLLLNPRFIGPCMAGLFCLIVATVVNIAYLFIMATVLLSLPVAGYIIGSIILKKCTVSREARVVTTQGEKVFLTIRIKTSLGILPPGLIVQDNLPEWIEIESNSGYETAWEQNVEIFVTLKAEKRGRYQLGPSELIAMDPLGMLKIRRQVPGVTELIVYPKSIPFRIGRLAGGNREFDNPYNQGKLAPRGDFAGVREYRQGDELKRIHWKTTARTQQLAVMEFEDSTTGSIVVMLDLSKGNDYGAEPMTALDVATSATAFVLRECLSVKRPVQLVLPSKDEMIKTDVHSPGSLATALTLLADARADSTATAVDLVRTCPPGAEAILITARAGMETVQAVKEAERRGIRLMVGLVDPQPFGRQSADDLSAAELERAGADVELIREAARQ